MCVCILHAHTQNTLYHTHQTPYIIHNPHHIPTPNTPHTFSPLSPSLSHYRNAHHAQESSQVSGHCTVSNVTFYRLLRCLFCFPFLFSSTLLTSLCPSLPRISYSPGYLWTHYIPKDDLEFLLLLTPPLHLPNAEVNAHASTAGLGGTGDHAQGCLCARDVLCHLSYIPSCFLVLNLQSAAQANHKLAGILLPAPKR